MTKHYVFLLLATLCWSCQSPPEESNTTETPTATDPQTAALDFAVEQYKRLDSAVPDSLIPRSFENGEHLLRPYRYWTSGFFPGSLVYLYEYSKDPALKQAYEDRFVYLEEQKNNTRTHDVGFMIQCSFGNALRITGDSARYVPIIVTAANSLISRYDENRGLIESWSWRNELNWAYPVIIDNMMNLELLFLATQLTGDDKYANIAKSHADQTMKNHFREDNSSFHVVSYNPDGTVEKKNTHQGIADESAWARGQAWGLYGYTMMYRFSQEERYLSQARKIADFVLTHPRLPADQIPYWDFDDPAIPNAPRDASAAAIMASALIDLGDFTSDKTYRMAGEDMINSLASDAYLAKAEENGNFILEHSTGNKPDGSEIDVPINYADYYFLEALMKLRQ
ncbi:MAG: glycoside hydrolase family 76 protein [Bacteroidota bacterium]